jgi:hypothetical protein
MNGSGSWNHGPASSSVHNGWFGGYNRNSQQSQQQADHLISPYVTGLPAEILEQVRIQHKGLLFFLFFFLFKIVVFDLLPSFHFVQSQVVAGAHNGQSIHAPQRGLVGYELQ